LALAFLFAGFLALVVALKQPARST
jgi:hypothetical protein